MNASHILTNRQPLFINLPYQLERAPPPFEGDEIKYPESLVRYFLDKYTKPKDTVFDPFSGHGTTLFVSEDMGRTPYGMEYDRKRYEWSAGQLENWTHLVNDDSAKMLRYGFPKMDFSITSPPYMPKNHKWNPLFAGDPAKNGYNVYLRRITHIYKQLSQLLKRNSYAVVQVDNLQKHVYTPLVSDISQAISKVMKLEAEIIVAWDNAKPDYPHTHCLLFKNTGK